MDLLDSTYPSTFAVMTNSTQNHC